jgi:hypothetical protein
MVRMAWWVLVVLTVVAVVSVGRWWLMREAHDRTREIIGARAQLPVVVTGRSKRASTRPAASAPRGTPVMEIPFFAELLSTDDDGQPRLHRLREELSEMGVHIQRARVGSSLSFRALLQSMGKDVPDTMTEAEAAAVFLREADRFSAVLAQWEQALQRAPWEFGKSHPELYLQALSGQLAMELRRVVGALTEAQWRVGNTEAAWKSFGLMHASFGDTSPYSRYSGAWLTGRLEEVWSQTYRTGLALGAFTNEQLAAMPSMIGADDRVALLRREMEQTQQDMADHYARRRENPGRGGSTGNPINDVFNQLGTSLVTSQQLADNQAVIQHAIDQVLNAFDPATGLLRPGRDAQPIPNELGRESDSWFNQWYFRYTTADGFGQYQGAPDWALHSQTTLDHMRLAAVLELHQRETGHYPDSLDAVSARLPGGAPRDLATGEPYGYRRLPEGGFRLWGRGLDQIDNGGTPGEDVVWER